MANFGACWCCLLLSWTWPRDSQLFSGESLQIGSLCWVRAYWFQRPIDSPSEPLASVSFCLWRGTYRVYFYVSCCGIRCLKVWGLGPSSTLFACPSFSKHPGGKGLVVAAHRVVMDTLRVQPGVTRGPTFLVSGFIPQAYLL